MKTIIEPFKIKMVEPIKLTTPQQREAILRRCHFNLFQIPAADILMAKNIPFAFCTGYAGAGQLPLRFKNASVITKPFSEIALVQTVAALLANH